MCMLYVLYICYPDSRMPTLTIGDVKFLSVSNLAVQDISCYGISSPNVVKLRISPRFMFFESSVLFQIHTTYFCDIPPSAFGAPENLIFLIIDNRNSV